MKELEQELQNIFDKRRIEYQSVFDRGDGLQIKADNAINFSKINEEFVDEIIATANAYIDKNPSISKAEAKESIQKMIPKFSWLMLNPFA